MKLKSKESNIRAFVKFVNTSERDVDVYWLNFKGEKISYSTLPPGTHCNINTYVTHPWVFSCSQTGERLKVNKNYVFFPEPWFKYITNAENGVVSVGRQETFIHYPLKSLKSICMWEILFLMNTSNQVDDLEIPKSLRSDMQQVQRISTRRNKRFRRDENSDFQNNDEDINDADVEFDDI